MRERETDIGERVESRGREMRWGETKIERVSEERG